MSAPLALAALNAEQDRSGFESGSDPVDRYFREQVSQDIRRRVVACFVATAKGRQIAGFYTLASASVLLTELADIQKRLPRYPSVPTVRMVRLAVSKNFQKQGLGGALLADALPRAARSEIAASALLVDAKDETATAFYRHHGFISLADTPRTLFLALGTVTKIERHVFDDVAQPANPET